HRPGARPGSSGGRPAGGMRLPVPGRARSWPADGGALGMTATRPDPMTIGGRVVDWGRRTYVMGILNLTPDSFSGDGIADAGVAAAVGQARRMVAEGADILD